MKRSFVAVYGALTVIATASACGNGSGDEADGSVTEITVAHVPSTLFAPLYIAQANGYFADEDLEVSLQTIQAGQDAVPLAASGQVDVVVAGFSAGLFSAVNTGLDVKVVGSMGISTGDPDASPTALEVSTALVDSGEIQTVADLEGRKIGVSGGPGAAGGYQLDVMLREAGLTIGDVETVNLSFPDMEAAIANGSVAAAVPPAPFTTKMEQSGVAVPLAVPPAGTVATGVIYGGAFADSDAAQPFFDALARAAGELQGDAAKTDENLQILAEATGQDIAVLEEVPFYTWLPDLAPQLDQLEAQQQTYLDAGLFDFDEIIPPETYIITDFSENAG